MSPPLDHTNGMSSCQFLVPSPMPFFAPPLSCIALAAAFSWSQLPGASVIPAFCAMSLRQYRARVSTYHGTP